MRLVRDRTPQSRHCRNTRFQDGSIFVSKTTVYVCNNSNEHGGRGHERTDVDFDHYHPSNIDHEHRCPDNYDVEPADNQLVAVANDGNPSCWD